MQVGKLRYSRKKPQLHDASVDAAGEGQGSIRFVHVAPLESWSLIPLTQLMSDQ
jgi:hypothetical protein